MEAATRALVRVRKMVPEDIAAARELSREQKWPHRTADWEFLLQRGDGIVADRDGEVVGTIIVWKYGEAAGTLGMVIVSPRCQGAGIGSKLMEAALNELGDRTVSLISTDEGQPLYRKFGFEPVGTIVQHQGFVDSVPLAELRSNERVRPMGRNDRTVIAELDRLATGMDRSEVISALLHGARGVMFVNNDETVGFALLRRFGRGFVVGPTVAPDTLAAKALLSHWLGTKVGKFCRLDVPGDSGLSDWLEERGLPRVGGGTIMVRGKPLQTAADRKLFSIISQALG